MENIRRAQVWMPIDTASLDIRKGPDGAAAFAPNETVRCAFDDKKGGGSTPKFWCDLPAEHDPVKVKYGKNNAEVYGEVAATRLLWALGFGSDREYPVKVLCRGCTSDPFRQGDPFEGRQVLFDPAAIEREFAGREIESRPDSGWSWLELDNVDPTQGGAPLAHRHALKLLAVFIQHTDSKPQQQRLVCLDAEPSPTGRCEKPLMMINDVGVTFGRANLFNNGGVDLPAWASMPIWKNGDACVGNLPKSWTGTLDDPLISEEGRRFLAARLMLLSDSQIRDLFDVARVTLKQPGTTLDDWVRVFKDKRNQVLTRTCRPDQFQYTGTDLQG